MKNTKMDVLQVNSEYCKSLDLIWDWFHELQQFLKQDRDLNNTLESLVNSIVKVSKQFLKYYENEILWYKTHLDKMKNELSTKLNKGNTTKQYKELLRVKLLNYKLSCFLIDESK